MWFTRQPSRASGDSQSAGTGAPNSRNRCRSRPSSERRARYRYVPRCSPISPQARRSETTTSERITTTACFRIPRQHLRDRDIFVRFRWRSSRPKTLFGRQASPSVRRSWLQRPFQSFIIAPQGQPLAAFVCPGHPLLDATIDLTLERNRDLLRRGAVLVDDRDPSTRPRVLSAWSTRSRMLQSRARARVASFLSGCYMSNSTRTAMLATCSTRPISITGR